MRHPVISGCLAAAFAVATAQADDRDNRGDGAVRTATPIKHLVVIFQENISYDHYFGTYPRAQNNPGEMPFKASKRTPINNNLLTPLDVNHGFKPFTGVESPQPQSEQQSQRARSRPTTSGSTAPTRPIRSGCRPARRRPPTRATTTCPSRPPTTMANGRFPGVGRHSRRYGSKRPASAASGRRHQGTDNGLLRRQHRHGPAGTTPSTTR